MERRLEQCGLGTCLAVGARVLGVADATVRLGLQVVPASGAVLTRITVAVGPYTDTQPTVTTPSRHLTNCIRPLDTPTSHDSLTLSLKTCLFHIHTYYY